MTSRSVRINLDQSLYDRAKQAAQADRRSLANWLTVLIDRALEDTSSDPTPES